MVVVWRITEVCNLACPFCAYDRRLAKPRTTIETARVLRFVRLLAQCQSETGNQVLLSWLGGEPLLWPALTSVSAECHRLNLALSITTNGTALERDDKRRLLSEQFAEVTVSVDAVGESHDHLRSWPGGFASLGSSVRWLAAEKRRTHRGPHLRANVVLMTQTWTEFPALCTALADWGINEITFNQLGGNDRPEYYPTHRLTPDDVAGFSDLVGPLRARLAQREVKLIGGDGYLRRIAASSRGERLPVADCGPGRRFLFIDERGYISPCSFTSTSNSVPLDDVVTVADFQALPRRFESARERQRPAACEDCHSTQVCEKFIPVLP